MSYRKTPLVEGNVYHVYTRSIAGYVVFSGEREYHRALETINFYVAEHPPSKFSSRPAVEVDKGEKLARIIAYCLMPTHIHLVLQQLKKNGISRLMNLAFNSYSSYFNKKHNRRGPLWESRFKVVPVESDEQLLHLTRYIHLNPVTAFLVNSPEGWTYSSYREYLGLVEERQRICEFSNCLEINALEYQRFVCDRIGYQRELARIKNLLIDE
ncbi:MAG: transposase [Candidatus Omnitrophica bacterium]|nr:transposase [Candidatus Omnitrophota bacterium]